MITLEASPYNGFFRLGGVDYPEKNYTLEYVTDITAPSEINYNIRNVFTKELIVNSRRANEFTGITTDAEFLALLDSLFVLSKGSEALQGRLYKGVIDYGDTSTQGSPVVISSGNGNLSTWVDLPNNGAGAFSVNTVQGITDILDVLTGFYDFSELTQGDLIRLRCDLRVTTVSPNTTFKLRLLLGGANPSAFPLEFGQRFYESATADDVFVQGTEVDLQSLFLLTEPSKIQIWANKEVSVKNQGVRNWLFL
jgi:hypothetical protein